MLFDFIQFCAQLAIALTLLRLAQAKFQNTAWGAPLAFLG